MKKKGKPPEPEEKSSQPKIKPLEWVGSSESDLCKFTKPIRRAMGYALYLAQTGERHSHARVMSGMGKAKVLEIREWGASGTYRTMYTTEIAGYIFVLHAFQKKSKTGIETSKQDIDLIKQRLKEAIERGKELIEGS
jgi:phage-related protein